MTREQLELSIQTNMPDNGVGFITASHTRQVAEDMADYVDSSLEDYVKSEDLAPVATTGDYEDLTNKPVIPDISNLVTVNTIQEIYGRKTFTNTTTFKNLGLNNSIDINITDENNNMPCQIGWGNNPETIDGVVYYPLITSIFKTSSSVRSRSLYEINQIDGNLNTKYFIPTPLMVQTTWDLQPNIVKQFYAPLGIATNNTKYLAGTDGLITLPNIPTKTSDLTNDSGFVTTSDLATVATTGDYDDLTNKPTIPTKTSDLTNDSGFVTTSDLATVATTGNYNDLTNKPTIPTKTSDLTNDSGFITTSVLATVATTGDYNDLINKPTIPDTTYMMTTNTDQNVTGSKTFAANSAELIFRSLTPGTGLRFLYSLWSTNTYTKLGQMGLYADSNGTNHFLYGFYNYSGYGTRHLQSLFGIQTYEGNGINGISAYRYLIPLADFAHNTWSLSSTYTDFWAILGVKMGGQNIKAGEDGLVDLNTAVTSSTQGLKIEVVSAMPATPDANTIYIVQ